MILAKKSEDAALTPDEDAVQSFAFSRGKWAPLRPGCVCVDDPLQQRVVLVHSPTG